MERKFLKLLLFSLIIAGFSGCRGIEESAKHGLSDGIYGYKTQTSRARRVYLQVEEDSLIIYPVHRIRGQVRADTTNAIALEQRERGSKAQRNYLIFTQPSFDIDIITILFKYRPQETYGPRQLNTDFNGAVYLGYRADNYRINYKPTPLGNYKRDLKHFGYSLGLFSGIGASMVAPWFTRDQVQIEYDGLVFINGIAGIVGVNNLTFGLGIGIDHLLDRNRKYWIYQGEPWVGLTLGLNLN